MRTTRFIAAVLLILALVFVFAACGKNTPPDKSEPTDQAEIKPPTSDITFGKAVSSDNMDITITQVSTKTALKGNGSIEYRPEKGAAYICVDATLLPKNDTELKIDGSFTTSDATSEGVDVYTTNANGEYTTFKTSLVKDKAENLAFCVPINNMNSTGQLELTIDNHRFVISDYRPGAVMPTPSQTPSEQTEDAPVNDTAAFNIVEMGYKDIIKARNNTSDTNAFAPSSHDDTFLYVTLQIENKSDKILRINDIVTMSVMYEDGETFELSSVFTENEDGTTLSMDGQLVQGKTVTCIAIVKVPKARQSTDGDLTIGVAGTNYLFEAPKN